MFIQCSNSIPQPSYTYYELHFNINKLNAKKKIVFSFAFLVENWKEHGMGKK